LDLTELKVTEEKLMAITNTYNLALSSSNAGSWVLDVATGKLVWDEHLQHVFGLPPGGFGGW